MSDHVTEIVQHNAASFEARCSCGWRQEASSAAIADALAVGHRGYSPNAVVTVVDFGSDPAAKPSALEAGRMTDIKRCRWCGELICDESECSFRPRQLSRTPEHNTKTIRHDMASCNTARHAEGGDCGTRFEMHCSCGYGQGASCREHALALERGHRADPQAQVISWDNTPLTADTITELDLRDLFGRHCECRPLDLERGEDDHAAIHDCDTAILHDVQIALGVVMRIGPADAKREARERCADFINEQRKAGR